MCLDLIFTGFYVSNISFVKHCLPFLILKASLGIIIKHLDTTNFCDTKFFYRVEFCQKIPQFPGINILI